MRRRLFPLLLGLSVAAPASADTLADTLDIAIGKKLFERAWVSAPATTRGNDGLGPLYNARSCAACHPGGDGMATFPGMALRLADDPVYGRQLQTAAVRGQPAEGHVSLRFAETPYVYPDGYPDGYPDRRRVTLRQPEVIVTDLAYGPLTAATSLRRAPPLFGLGLLERLPGGARFGWKGEQPDLTTQASAAFHLDIGMSTPAFPDPWGDCTAAQAACRAGPHGSDHATDGTADGAMLGDTEIAPAILAPLVAYVAALPPPPPAPSDPAGSALFTDTGCAACHVPAYMLDGAAVAPYSDMKLHDMGRELADGVAVSGASGSQWRTSPLWGLRAPEHRRALLHDGRAADVEQAILWHGGEAEAARRRFVNSPATVRERLLRFVESL